MISTHVYFITYPKFKQNFYNNLFTKDRENYSKTTKKCITIASGFFSGICYAFITHPIDTIISNIYSKPNTKTESIR